MNIYVSNLNYNTSSGSLKELFEGHGETTSAKVITDMFTGKSRGFGFVEMPVDAEGQKAIDDLNATDFEGKTINVTVARPKTERSGNSFNRRMY